MARKIINLKNKIFGRWKVLDKEPIRKREYNHIVIYWKCECSCENKTKKLIRASDLKNNKTQSCGCLTKEINSKLKRKENVFKLENSYGIGYTSKGKEFYFDLEDYDKIKEKYWFIDKFSGGYVYYWNSSLNKKESMHRFVMNYYNKDLVIDHINRNKLDNRKENLRICSMQTNSRNISLHKNNTSGVSGVSWHNDANKWVIRINNGKEGRIILGYFKNFEDAVKIRREAEIKYGYIKA